MVETVRIDEHTWRFEDGFVRFFLLEGSEMAALIDSGVDCPDAADMAKHLTDRPVILINTHGDGDHTSGTGGFDTIFMHPADYDECEVQKRYPGTDLAPLHDGDIIDLGGRPIRIIHIPGHTKGSIAILDTANRTLYAGDSVQKGHIYMFGSKRCPEQFESSLNKLIGLKDEYDFIYASHDEPLLPADHVDKVRLAWTRMRAGQLSYELTDLFGNQVKTYTTPDCGFYTE